MNKLICICWVVARCIEKTLWILLLSSSLSTMDQYANYLYAINERPQKQQGTTMDSTGVERACLQHHFSLVFHRMNNNKNHHNPPAPDVSDARWKIYDQQKVTLQPWIPEDGWAKECDDLGAASTTFRPFFCVSAAQGVDDRGQSMDSNFPIRARQPFSHFLT